MCCVSIVLPSYNGEDYLEESINSILQQTLTDWELILVDDCSDDGTLLIMERYEKMDDRIKIITNNQNMNLPNSLNIGFSHASGKYLTWTSDDNLYHVSALEEMYHYMEENKNVYMVCADMKYIDDKGRYKGDAHTYDEKKFWFNNNVGACFMYRSEVRSRIGEYNTDLFGVEDYDYWLRIRKKCGEIQRLDKVLYSYRLHENSLTATRFYQIKEKLNCLRSANWKQMVTDIQGDAEKMAIWFEMVLCGYKMDSYKDEFQIEEIDFYKEFDEDNDKILIYGAGEFGKRAKELLGDNVIGFIDSDSKKTGTIYEGKPVYSIVDAERRFKGCQIVVAVDALKLYEIAKEYSDNKGKLIMTSFHQMFAKKRI